MTQARQGWELLRFKYELSVDLGEQQVSANAYKAIQMAKALYGKLLSSGGTFPLTTE